MTELEYAKAYNAEFSRLNPTVPLNAKWDAIEQMKYNQATIARLAAQGGTQYKVPYVNQTTPTTPAVTPTTPPPPASLMEALTAARYVVKQLEALVG